MILKIKNEFTELGWFIIDSIAEVSYSWIKKGKEIGCDRHFDSVKNEIELSNEEQVQILITFKDKHEEIFLTEVKTFLLNDCGKTIEKIY